MNIGSTSRQRPSFSPLVVYLGGQHDQHLSYITQEVTDSDFVTVVIAEIPVDGMTDKQIVNLLIKPNRHPNAELFCEDLELARWEGEGGRYI